MSGQIGQDKIAEVRQSSSIVEIVSEHVGLKRVGRNHVGLCPFHAEKTPSFTVNQERGIFHCFGCGVGGDVFGFVMRIEGISFPEAVRRLARRAGISLPMAERERQAAGINAQLFAINELATRFFIEQLTGRPMGGAARQYLERRGIGKATTERFRLGYAPGLGQELVRFLQRHNVPMPMAGRLGLIGQRERDGTYYDRFRHRVIFPVTDLGGRVVGFGSRILDETAEMAKYINSPETPLFRKGRYLYGLEQAREAIRRTGRALVVEGYFDVLSLSEHGIDYAVALLGTALSAAQLTGLGRFTREIIACFDGDAAGENAAERSLPIFLDAGLWGRGAFLPTGDDPDSFVRKHGKDSIEKIIASATSLLDFFLLRVKPPPQADPGQQADACRRVAGMLQKVKDPFAYDAAVRKAAEMLNVSEALLRREGKPGPAGGERKAAVAPLSVEARLVGLMVVDPDVAAMVENTGILGMFQEGQWRETGEEIVVALKSSGRADVAELLGRVPEEVAARLTEQIVGQESAVSGDEVRREVAADLISSIRRRHLKRLAAAVRDQIREAERQGDASLVKAGLQKLEQLGRERS